MPLAIVTSTGPAVRVLIAEDDTVTGLILKHWILRGRYEVVVIDNGIDARKLLEREQPPEVVIVD